MIDKHDALPPATETVHEGDILRLDQQAVQVVPSSAATEHIPATNGRIITGWQINLSHRLGQIAKEPGTYYFRLEVKPDGRKVLVLMDGKDEVLGK